MEKLIIKNFGPIKDAEVELRDILILIGPQASGKSTIAKLFYFFKKIPNRLSESLYNYIVRGNENDVKSIYQLFHFQLINDIDNIFGSDITHKENTYAAYDNEKLAFAIHRNEKKKLQVSYGIETIGKIENCIKRVIEKNKEYDNTSPKLTIFLAEINDIISDELNVVYEDDFYIPAGRSYMSSNINIVDLYSLTRLQNANNSIDVITLEYLNFIERSRKDFTPKNESDSYFSKNFFTNEYHSFANKIEYFTSKILKGRYYFDGVNDHIRLNDKDSVLLRNASSGQQEVIWILNYILKYIFFDKKLYTTIEEPEAHLFPVTQKDLMEFVSLFQRNTNNKLTITTHSPYILEAFNNMIAAGEKGKEFPDKVNEIMHKDIWQTFDKVIAYNVENGGVENIMDEEIKQIKLSYIDRVSKDINKQYDAIFDIQ